jgi:hypothetical protein
VKIASDDIVDKSTVVKVLQMTTAVTHVCLRWNNDALVNFIVHNVAVTGHVPLLEERVLLVPLYLLLIHDWLIQ